MRNGDKVTDLEKKNQEEGNIDTELDILASEISKNLAKELAKSISDQVKTATSSSKDNEVPDLTDDEKHAIKKILKIKDNTVRIVLYIIGIVIVWAVRDMYDVVADSIKKFFTHIPK